MSSSTVRNIVRRSPLLKRHVSSKPTPSPPEFSLPPSKLRALISLYHRSGQFITAEGLDDAIDRAFTVKDQRYIHNSPFGLGDLKSEVTRQRSAPKFGRVIDNVVSKEGMYEERERRVAAVFEALYGTQEGRKPGLEILQERWDLVDQTLSDAASEGQKQS